MQVKETSPRYNKKTYTYQDYLDLPEDGERYEVINGELVMVPAPDTNLQDVSGKIEFELRKFNEKIHAGKIFDAPIDVVLSEENIHQPDILFIANENSQIITNKNISGAPDLIVEILSPSTAYYDLVEKKDNYEKFGVKEYWIVDPKKRRVELHVNEKHKFTLEQRLEKTGILKSVVLQGFEIPLNTIFE